MRIRSEGIVRAARTQRPTILATRKVSILRYAVLDWRKTSFDSLQYHD